MKKQPTQLKKVTCQLNANVPLTKGKEYEVIGEVDNKYIIIDDKGKKTTYYKSRF